MNFNNLKNIVMKHSPEILVVAGIAGTIVSTIMACRATLKLDDILEEHNKDADRIRNEKDNEELPEYTEDIAKRDLAVTYLKTGVRVARLYGPAVVCGVVSIGMILKGHNILQTRNAGLAAAFAGLNTSFNKYRSYIISQYGEEVDQSAKNGVTSVEVKKDIVGEDGKKKKVKEKIGVLNSPDDLSDYAVVFDETNKYYEYNDSSYNEHFLNLQQSHANDVLRIRGRLFLNDVYKMIGMPETKAGQVVGWIYDKTNPKYDNYVDFGVKKVYRNYILNPDEPAPDLSEMLDPVYILDFNVDGDVWSSM